MTLTALGAIFFIQTLLIHLCFILLYFCLLGAPGDPPHTTTMQLSQRLEISPINITQSETQSGRWSLLL